MCLLLLCTCCITALILVSAQLHIGRKAARKKVGNFTSLLISAQWLAVAILVLQAQRKTSELLSDCGTTMELNHSFFNTK